MKAPDVSQRLEGVHVTIAPMEERHIEGLAVAASDSELWSYMPVRQPISREAWNEWFGSVIAARDRGEEVPFVLIDRTSGTIAGSTRYLDISTRHRGLEIGWTFVAPDFQRTAINTEAKLLLLGHAFEQLNTERVCIKTDGRNLRAQRAIERLGATREGVLRRHRVLPDGFIRDSVYYSVIREEWAVVRENLSSRLAQAR